MCPLPDHGRVIPMDRPDDYRLGDVGGYLRRTTTAPIGPGTEPSAGPGSACHHQTILSVFPGRSPPIVPYGTGVAARVPSEAHRDGSTQGAQLMSAAACRS